MNPVLDIRGLSKRFGAHVVLDELDLELPAGATTVLLGANGTGKSTLIRLVLGLERPEAGSIRVCGLDPIRDAAKVRARIGFVPDRPDVYEWMTPRELFAFLRPQYARWDRKIESRVASRLEVPLSTRFASLSRGEAAKAMLVAALSAQPDLYLFDEAFSGLDALVRDDVLAAFLAEVDLAERAALVVTHELDLAARLADRVAVLADGSIRSCTSAEDLFEDGEHGDQPRRLKDLLAESTGRSAA
jgi:ABC-2 type transport system ATP-binding protein